MAKGEVGRGARLTEGKAGPSAGRHGSAMQRSTIFSLSGIAILAAAGASALAAVLVGSAQWLGLNVPLSLPVPPQTLVIGGLFLAVPVAAVGYGLLWFGHWLKANR